MKLKIKEVIGVNQELKFIQNMELSADASWIISEIPDKIASTLKRYESERLKLCQKFGKIGSDGQNYEFTDKNREHFNDEYNKLMNREVEIDITKIDRKAFSDVKLSPRFFINMKPILK